mmetsp:Transcript_32863/g.44686  ORF Transcript_32863/g.44686 Transcript_32863/m.44686 type:complete len:104 (-) Transcript_32863:45-356(-)
MNVRMSLITDETGVTLTCVSGASKMPLQRQRKEKDPDAAARKKTQRTRGGGGRRRVQVDHSAFRRLRGQWICTDRGAQCMNPTVWRISCMDLANGPQWSILQK